MRALIALISLLLIPAWLCAAGDSAAIRAGNKAYNKQKYGEAFDLYQSAADEGVNLKAVYNSGAALYRLKDYALSSDSYNEAAEGDGGLRQSAYFNAGSAYYMQGEQDKAIDILKQAVLLNLKDKDAVHNLQFIIQQKNESQQDPENKEGKDQQDKQDQDENSDEQDKQGNQPQDNQKSDSEQNEDTQDTDRQEPEQDEQKLSKEEAQSILQMVKDDGRPARPLPQGGKPQDSQLEKDW